MRFPIIIAVVSLVLAGCASYHGTSVPSQRPVSSKPKKQKTATISETTPKKESTTGMVFELINETSLTLQFKNVDDESYMTVVIEKDLSQKSFPVGHWELTGFEENGHSFVSMNTTKKFVLRSKENSLNYGGTILVGCPSIPKDSTKILKQMKFFDRYPFSGPTGICEMVVGDNFAAVRSALKKARKSKQLKLIMGF